MTEKFLFISNYSVFHFDKSFNVRAKEQLLDLKTVCVEHRKTLSEIWNSIAFICYFQ